MDATANEDTDWEYIKLDIRGIVQKVNFRVSIRQLATSLDIVGIVENNKDDPHLVHVIAEGQKKNIHDFIVFIRKMVMERPRIEKDKKTGQERFIGPRYQIHVKDAEVVERRKIGEDQIQFNNFTIIREHCDDPALAEISEKLSVGGAVYQQFHRDHNENFNHLDEKYHSVSNNISGLRKEMAENFQGLREDFRPMIEFFTLLTESDWFKNKIKEL